MIQQNSLMKNLVIPSFTYFYISLLGKMIYCRTIFCFISLWIFLHNAFILSAQVMPVKDYPQGYFGNPLNIPINLSGNFGELRSNHFHMGIDIKTLKKKICLFIHPQMDMWQG